MARTSGFQLPALIATATLFIAACGSTSTSTDRTHFDKEFKGTRYSNVLVIAVADNYNARAQYERTTVSAIRATGAEATAYYTVIGHNPEVTVNDVTNAIRSRGFDAVLFTRVKGSTQAVNVKDGPADASATTRGGNVFNLFRYDYEEYKEPENVRISTNVVLLSELYDVAQQKMIWAVESSSFNRESVEMIVDSSAQAVVKRLDRDKLIGSK